MSEKTTKQYDEFVAKFEKRQSSDDCFTPPLVYEAVVKYCERRFGIDRTKIVRPFCPGGDFENFDYPEDCYVIDNPPFSIMSRILKFFISHKIKYFLFTQSLTAFSCLRFNHTTLLYANETVIYDNKANVKTAFYHNLGDLDILFETDPAFSRELHIANDISQEKKPRPPQKIVLPDCILNTQKAAAISTRLPITIRYNEGVFCSACGDYDIYGGGVLLSDAATKSVRAALDQIAAQKQDEADATIVQKQLSPLQKKLQQALGKKK